MTVPLFRFRGRGSRRLGRLPVWINFTQAGYSSTTFRIWRWSWNSRTRDHSFNTPGWGRLHISRGRES